MSDTAPKTGAHVFWLCGLSGAGKSTIADAARDRLVASGLSVLNLDGDVIRDRLHTKLGFSREDVLENNLGIARLCDDRRAAHDVILVPVISPLREGRDKARTLLADRYNLIYCDADVATVRARDVKGLYARADGGEIRDMIGYSPGGLPFERPDDADLVLHTAEAPLDRCVDELVSFIESQVE
jgi:adenylyl-sulfate kinase